MFVPSLEITATATLQMQTLLSSHLCLHLPFPYPNVALENYTPPPSPIPSHSPLQSRGRRLCWRSRGRSATTAGGVTTRRWRRRERVRIAMEAVISDDGVATSEFEVTDPFLEVRNEVADAAGEVVRKYFHTKSFTILDKDDLSLVTIADREAEEAMVSIISRNFPSHAILNWQHQLCKNRRPNLDIKTLFVDHSCGQPNGARAPSPVANAFMGPIQKPRSLPQLAAHGPCHAAPANLPASLSGWMVIIIIILD